MCIYAYQNGVAVGFVRSLSYTRMRASFIQDRNKAKHYTSFDMATADVDTLAAWYATSGYVFTIV